MTIPRRCQLSLAALALAGLAACAQEPPVVPTVPPPAPPSTIANPTGDCDAQPAQTAVGRVLDTALTEQLRSATRAQRVRVVRPGEMVTMEFDPGRLTVQVDAAGKVLAVRCG